MLKDECVRLNAGKARGLFVGTELGCAWEEKGKYRERKGPYEYQAGKITILS